MINVKQLAHLVRRWILQMTTKAGSGHPTSSMSAVELMLVLMFSDEGFFRFDVENPERSNNDRLIFSKGHASPLFYALWTAAGGVKPEELMTFRKFESRLEGHPTRQFPYTEVPTGSLGQGLSIGFGEALNAKKIAKNDARIFVLLGDSEMAEGSVWEAAQLAAYYKTNNLVAIVDVNRLGQRGETMYGHNIDAYAQKFTAFGWDVEIVRDGHDIEHIQKAYAKIGEADKPLAILAKTIKGKGVSFLEDEHGWHGKALSQEECEQALSEIGEVNEDIYQEFTVWLPSEASETHPSDSSEPAVKMSVALGDSIATRKVYGKALAAIARKYPEVVALDAEVSNSTYAKDFADAHPDRFFEMFIAEQNMVSAAVGMARRGCKPFVSTFGAFMTRAFDQIRMAQYAKVNVSFVGSHVGVSIGEDGSSQMGLEDMAAFRALLESTILYPSDAVSMKACVRLAAEHDGLTYIRTTRAETPVLYTEEENFEIGGSKILKESEDDAVTVVAAGITIPEALHAYDELKKEGIVIRVIDVYSVKPIDVNTLEKALKETQAIITVEDHYPEGGLGAAVREAICGNMGNKQYESLAVRKIPHSGTPEELLRYEEIDSEAIIQSVKRVLKQ